MTNRERVQWVLNGKRPDRLPVIEWATWWNLTIDRWLTEGLTLPGDNVALQRSLGLDPLCQLWLQIRDDACPTEPAFGAGIIKDASEYGLLRSHLFGASLIQRAVRQAMDWKSGHENGDYAVWLTLEGFFWFPRTMLGIEGHLFAFFDSPELIHAMNRDLTAFYEKCLAQLLPVLKPEFMTFAEDLSYKCGSMISKEQFDEFLAPYYRAIIPLLKQHQVKVLVDTDGFVEPLIPWFSEVGIEGVLPLERQSLVDVNRIRAQYPNWLMIGGYDKTILHLGEAAMRDEFERLLPAMGSGRYIPSVDHQTPPDVSFAQYQQYTKLLRHYARLAVKEGG